MAKRRFSFLSVAWLSLVLMGVGYFLTGNAVEFGPILGTVFLAGLGLSMFVANLTFWVLELSPAEVRGKKLGFLTACLFFGQFSDSSAGLPPQRNDPNQD